jgi:hypothetical protein
MGGSDQLVRTTVALGLAGAVLASSGCGAEEPQKVYIPKDVAPGITEPKAPKLSKEDRKMVLDEIEKLQK